LLCFAFKTKNTQVRQISAKTKNKAPWGLSDYLADKQLGLAVKTMSVLVTSIP